MPPWIWRASSTLVSQPDPVRRRAETTTAYSAASGGRYAWEHEPWSVVSREDGPHLDSCSRGGFLQISWDADGFVQPTRCTCPNVFFFGIYWPCSSGL
jgi:hypothetical protein